MEIKGVGEKSPAPSGGSLGGMGNYYMKVIIYFFGKILMRGGAVQFPGGGKCKNFQLVGGTAHHPLSRKNPACCNLVL